MRMFLITWYINLETMYILSNTPIIRRRLSKWECFKANGRNSKAMRAILLFSYSFSIIYES